MIVPTIFCILWYIFLLNVAIYAFIFLFSCVNIWASFQAMTQYVGKGKGQTNPLWMQAGEMMNGVIMNGKRVI